MRIWLSILVMIFCIDSSFAQGRYTPEERAARIEQMPEPHKTTMKCAIKGDVECIFKMGALFDQGYAGGPRGFGEPEIALTWYLIAAKKGHKEAAYYVGSIICLLNYGKIPDDREQRIEGMAWYILYSGYSKSDLTEKTNCIGHVELGQYVKYREKLPITDDYYTEAQSRARELKVEIHGCPDWKCELLSFFGLLSFM